MNYFKKKLALLRTGIVLAFKIKHVDIYKRKIDGKKEIQFVCSEGKFPLKKKKVKPLYFKKGVKHIIGGGYNVQGKYCLTYGFTVTLE